MIKVIYSELEGENGPTCRLEAVGHAGYAPAGQDIVCAGASTLMQALICLLADTWGVKSTAEDGPDGPRLTVTADSRAFLEPYAAGAYEMAKAGFMLLAERYPDNLSYADVSASGEQGMLDLQLFAAEAGDSGEGAAGADAIGAEPTLSRAQRSQARAAGTLKEAKATANPEPKAQPTPQQPPKRQVPRQLIKPQEQRFVRRLHGRWAAEEAAMRREQPEFSFKKALENPEMRRMMRIPGMRMQDAYRAAHYNELMERTARQVEQGVMERVRQRGARAAENGARPGGAVVTHPDVERMTRAEREALERQALHGAKIRL